MSVLRRHIVLLDQSGVGPTSGSSFALVPSDADVIPDAYQTFVALVSVTRPVPVPPPSPVVPTVPGEVVVPITPAPGEVVAPIVAAPITPAPTGPALPGTPTGPRLPGGVVVGPGRPLPGGPTTPTTPTTPSTPTTPTLPAPGSPSTPTPTVPGVPGAPTPTVPTTPVDGSIVVVVEGSFDQEHWAALGSVTLLPTATLLERLVELGPVPPHVRARVYESAGATAFDWIAYVALGSTAAFRVRAVA